MRSLLQRLARSIPAIGDWARRAWCRRQRQRLVGVTATVLWVPADKVQWALWGCLSHDPLARGSRGIAAGRASPPVR